jgi:hypothetical protein
MPSRNRIRVVLLMGAAICRVAVCCGSSPDGDAELVSRASEFQNQLRQIQSEVRSTDFQPQLVPRYQELIQAYADVPGVAEAIRDLGDLFARNYDIHANPREDSLDQAIGLYKQARERSVRGGEIWTEASFRLAYQLRRHLDTTRCTPEARSVLEEIGESSHSVPNVDFRLQEQLVLQCVAERDYAGAERICRELLQISRPGKEAPELERSQQIAASALVNGIIRDNDSDRISLGWFQKFASDFPQHAFVKDSVTALQGQMSVDPLTLNGNPGEDKLLLILNLAAIGLFVWWSRFHLGRPAKLQQE